MGKTKLGLGAATTIALTALVLASSVHASHVRPKGATPLRDSLVIAQKPCPVGSTTHNSPPTPAPQACTPPTQISPWVTVGTPDANGAGANSLGFVQLTASASDILVQVSMSDVRCQPSTAPAVCTPANAAAGADYVGQLQLLVGLQITDHFNGSSFSQTGTAVLVPYPVNVSCAATSSTAVGANCAVNTSFNAVVPGSAPTGKRTVYEIPQGVPSGGIQVYDGGQNGIAGSTGATLFAESGVFVP